MISALSSKFQVLTVCILLNVNVLTSQLFIITHDDTVPKRENIVCKSSSYNLKRKSLIVKKTQIATSVEGNDTDA